MRWPVSWAMSSKFGFGLNRVALKADDTPIGGCGLLQRESLEDCDLGFALLPEFRAHGYGVEAAHAILRHGFTQLDKSRITAIVSEGKIAKFIERVEHLTFSGEYAIERGQKIPYITERAVFQLDGKGPCLIEIAPRGDLERDILAHMGFTPRIADPPPHHGPIPVHRVRFISMKNPAAST